MHSGKKIAVVVPAYNEEILISNVINTMPVFVDHIIVINDASIDNTKAVVESLVPLHKRITLINHHINLGVGGAIATGYKWAKEAKIDITVVMAGDAQMDPEDLLNIIEPLLHDTADYAKGNRLVSGEAYSKIPKIRYFGNSILTLLTKIASGYWHVTDSQTGYTAINLKALETIDWDKLHKRYGCPNDLLIKLNIYNFRVRDVPIKPVYNIGEKSGIKISSVIFTISFLLFKGFFWRLKEKYIIRDFHPLVFFYLMAFILGCASFVLGIRLLFFWIKLGYILHMTFFALMFSFTMGLQSTFFAMWLDSDYNKNLK